MSMGVNRTRRSRTRVLHLLALLAGAALPAAASAETPGVAALIEQGRFWQAKGRQDLADQAYRRALALDPANAEARRGLAGPTPPPNASRAAAPAASMAPPAARAAPDRMGVDRQSADDRGADARAAGFRALDRGQLDSAQRQFGRAIASNGQDADALGGMGLVRLRQERFADARALLDRASRLGDPAKWADALASARFYAGLDEARAALGAGRVAQAQEQAQALVRSGYARTGPALELLADIYERQGRYADAADILGQIGESGPAVATRLRSRAARDRALQAAAQGDDDAAMRLFQSGLLLNPQDPWIRYEFARYLIGKGRLPEIDSLRSALVGLGTPDALYAAALLDVELGQPARAQALMMRIADADRSAAMRSFAQGLTIDSAIAHARDLAGRGQTGQALAALHQLADATDMPAIRQAAIADALYDLGDTDGAALLAQRALAGDIDDPAGYEPVVRILARTGQDARATQAVQRAAGLADGSAQGALVVARLNGILAAAQGDRLRLAGHYAQAFDMLQSAWNAAPGNRDILATLARLYQSGGLNAQAAQSYQIILAQSPQDRAALIGLIQTAGAAGDGALARATIARALQAWPDDYEIYLAAARMEQARGDTRAALRYLKRARDLYAARAGAAAGRITAANPFAATLAGDNPFQQPAPAPTAAINPFALDGGTRPPQPPSPPGPASPGGDPVMADIQSDLRALSQQSGPRGEVNTGYRQRSGEAGLSALKEVTGSAEVSTGLLGGRISAKAQAVVLDSGQPTRSGLARLGRNATAEAQGIVAALPSQLSPAQTQHASGLALSLDYDSQSLQFDLGTTPLGFEDRDVTWRAAAKPRFSPDLTGTAWVERRPVTDSILSYAGTRDPVTGAYWGQVMRTGAGLSLSYDHDGAGLYADASYSRYAGAHVRDNRGIQVNMGGYMPLLHGARGSLVAGLNVNFQDFANNQNFFTFGHGGYFSPQSFFSVSFPLRYARDDDRLELRANVAPGFQSYRQDEAPLYPTDPAGQALLDSLKAQDSDVRSYYDSISKTGFALSADGSLYYRLTPRTRVGGDMAVNTFGTYDEYRFSLGLRQSLGGGK